MFVKALEAKNFKKLKDSRIEFPGDISVIKGKNESGKSTTLEALYAALFFDPTIASTPQYIKNFKSWHSDHLYTLKLFFEVNGENYILEKDFENQNVLLKKEDGDVLSHDMKTISDFMRDNGGYENKDLFGNVAVIKKEVLALLDTDKKKIMESLQDMVSGASSISVSTLLKKFKSKVDELDKGLDPSRPVKNPGTIKLLEERIVELEENLKSMKNILTTKEQSQTVLRELKEVLETAKKEKEILDLEYKANSEYFSARNEIEKITKQLDIVLADLATYEKLEKERMELEEKVKNAKLPKEEDLDEIEAKTQILKFKGNELEKLEAILKEAHEQHKKVYRPNKKLFIGGSLALGLLGFLGFVYSFFFVFWAGLVVFSVWMFVSGKYQESTGIKSLEADRDKQEDELIKEQKELKKLLAKFGVDEASELKNINKSVSESKNRINSIDNEKRTLLRGRSIDQLKDESKELHKQLGVQDSRIKDEYKMTPPDPKRQREIEHRLQELDKEISKTSDKYTEVKAKVDIIDTSQEDIATTEEKLAVLKDRINDRKRRSALYKIIQEALEQARVSSLSKTREALEGYMADYIGEITGGRYTSIRLTNNLDVEAYSSEKDDFVSSEELSTGTIDQLYIVARFALVQLLYNKGSQEGESSDTLLNPRPLIIFDDPFSNFDEERRDKMRELLSRLSKDFQIIMLTCVSDYDNWGELVEI